MGREHDQRRIGAGASHLTPEEQRIVRALERLFLFFPEGSDEKTKRAYYDRLVGAKRPAEDVEVVVERLIEIHDGRKVPAFAKLLDRLREITRQRNEPELVDLDCRDLTPAGIALDIERLRLYRGMDMPKRCSKRHGPKPLSKDAAPVGETPAKLPRMTHSERSLCETLDDTWNRRRSPERDSASKPKRRSIPDPEGPF